ncbi:pyocin S6 family toxin immunity protein [Pseudomonas syringae]|nr:pyocin S6 family toxin immunity protein [Pseudomonas syringae]
MFLWISGFLKDDAEDDALKFDLVVKPEYEDAVLNILGWESLEESPDGEWLLSMEQVGQVSTAVNEPLPSNLDVFIGVRA